MATILPSADAYPQFVKDSLRAELRRRRLARGLSLRKMAIPHKLTAQTLANIEHGSHCPSVYTLALLCGRLEVGVEEFMASALDQPPST